MTYKKISAYSYLTKLTKKELTNGDPMKDVVDNTKKGYGQKSFRSFEKDTRKRNIAQSKTVCFKTIRLHLQEC